MCISNSISQDVLPYDSGSFQSLDAIESVMVTLMESELV
jgi:hypothetical protein